ALSAAEKSCPRCNIDLRIEEFGISRARKVRRNIYCKRCNRDRTNESRRSARERSKKQKSGRGKSRPANRIVPGSNNHGITNVSSFGSLQLFVPGKNASRVGQKESWMAR